MLNQHRTLSDTARTFLLIALVLLVASPALAVGRLRGSVKDTAGDPIPEVELSLIPTDTSLPTVTIRSNKKGKFVFGLIRPSAYSVLAKHEGMRVKRIDANVAVPEDESLWAFHEDLVLGAELPQFSVTGLTTVSYDMILEAYSGDVGKYGTGLPVSPTAAIVKMIEDKRIDEALEEIDRSLQVVPGAAALHYLRAVVLQAQGRPDDAVTSIERALELEPGFEGARLLKGKVLEDQGDLEQAMALFRTESETAQTVEVKRDALIALATASIQAERPDDAISALEMLITVTPDYVGAYKELADLYVRKGDKEKAAAMMQKVSELGASDPNLLYNLGAERFNANDFQAAAEYFTEAVTVNPEFREAHLRLAYTRLSLGEMDQAAESLQTFLGLSPEETDEVHTARAILQQIQQNKK